MNLSHSPSFLILKLSNIYSKWKSFIRLCTVKIDLVLCIFTYRSVDYSAFESAIITTEPEPKSFFSAFTTTKLNFPGSESQIRFPFLLAQLDYSPSEPRHLDILRTLYSRLTGVSTPVSPTGPQWDDIGFQGLDPCTDINRAMKMLAVLQVFTIWITSL
jgi:hypothetical protein